MLAVLLAVLLIGVLSASRAVAAPPRGAGAVPVQVPAPTTSPAPGTTQAPAPEAPGAPAAGTGAGDAPANTPQPTGQPLPSKGQRIADSLVAAFLLAVLVGGVAFALVGNRRSRRRTAAERAGRHAAAVEPNGASH